MLDVAVEAARAGGSILMQGLVRDMKIHSKDNSRTSIVTWADIKSQEKITEIITGSFPEHTIVGEEGKSGKPGSDFTWYVDPLDGTSNYSHGFPCYCVSIALCDSEGIALGIVYDPYHEDLFLAERGGGAVHNGENISVAGTVDLRDSLLSTQVQSDDINILDRYARRSRRFAGTARAVRSIGSPALALAYVAKGWLDVFCEPDMSPWDTLAGSLLILESGGMVTTFTGQQRPLDCHADILGSNGLLHDNLLDILGEEIAETDIEQKQKNQYKTG